MSDLSPETEKTIIKVLEEVKMMSGDTRYLITTKWLKSWKAYVVYDISMLVREESRPGPIDNTPIFEKLEGSIFEILLGFWGVLGLVANCVEGSFYN